jgi:hypothetical protein
MLVMQRFGSELWFEPDLSWTGPWSSSMFRVYISPVQHSAFLECVDYQLVVNYWCTYQHHSVAYPTLSRMARDYLAIQGSATPSEQAFSSGSITDQSQHNQLTPDIFISKSQCSVQLWTELHSVTRPQLGLPCAELPSATAPSTTEHTVPQHYLVNKLKQFMLSTLLTANDRDWTWGFTNVSNNFNTYLPLHHSIFVFYPSQ